MTRPRLIPLATFKKDDGASGALNRILWEPRTGVVWLAFPNRSGATVYFPTLYFAKRRDEIDALVADVWGRRFPLTFEAIPRRER